jgi:hypothetical protein
MHGIEDVKFVNITLYHAIYLVFSNCSIVNERNL